MMSANNLFGLASMREVSSMAFNQILAAEGLACRGLPSVTGSITPTLIAELPVDLS
jgi:hypothetical protein